MKRINSSSLCMLTLLMHDDIELTSRLTAYRVEVNHSLDPISIGRVAQRSLICVLQCRLALKLRLAVAHVPLIQAHRVQTSESSS